MARLDDLVASATRHDMKIGTIRDLIAGRLLHDHSLERKATSTFRARWGDPDNGALGCRAGRMAMTETGSALRGALLLSCALTCVGARTQGLPPTSAAASAAERAQKESDRTMYWIRVLAVKPAPTKAAPAPKPVVAAPAQAARPAKEAREKPKGVDASTPVATNTVTDSAKFAAPGAVAQPAPLAQALGGDAPDATPPSGIADNVAAAVPVGAVPGQPDVALPAAAEPDPGLVNVKLVQPDFPFEVVQRMHKGSVKVRFEVEPGGTVVEAAVVESSNPRLNNAALAAVKQWRYQPTPNIHIALVNLVFNIDAER